MGDGFFEHCLPRCVISPSSVLLHRSAIEEFGNFDESLPVCEDYDLWLRLTATLPVMLISEPLVKKYGGHTDQLSRSRWGMDRYRIRSLETLLAAKTLTAAQKQQALEELTRKIDIYLAGARRRQRKKRDSNLRLQRSFLSGPAGIRFIPRELQKTVRVGRGSGRASNHRANARSRVL